MDSFAHFIVMWSCENMLLNGFLNWSLKMLVVMCCYQTSMLLVVTCISVGMLNWQRNERSMKKQPGCTWIEVNNEVHTFVVHNQDHPQMIEVCAEPQRLSWGSCIMWGTWLILNWFCKMWKKKKRCSIFVSIARNCLLHWGSSTQLLVLLSK